MLDDVFLHAQLDGGLLDEHGALARGVEIERIDVEAVAATGQQIHFQQVSSWDSSRKPAHAIAAVAQRDGDLFAVHLERHVRGGRRISG